MNAFRNIKIKIDGGMSMIKVTQAHIVKVQQVVLQTLSTRNDKL